MKPPSQEDAIHRAYDRGELTAEEALALLRALHRNQSRHEESVPQSPIDEDERELLAIPRQADRELVIARALKRHRSPDLAARFIERSIDQLSLDLSEAASLRDTAVCILNHAQSSSHAEELRVATIGVLAGIYKAQGALDRAQNLLAVLEKVLVPSFVIDPVMKAHMFALAGSFWKDRRHLEKSEHLLARSVLYYELMGQTRHAARARITASGTLLYLDRVEEAIEVAESALRHLSAAEDPLLYLMVQHNIALYLCAAGQAHQAAQRFKSNARLYEIARDRVPAAASMFHWLAGRIHLGLGRLVEAEAHLIRARDGFLQRSNHYDAVLVCLDLTLVHLQGRRPQQVLELVEVMIPSYAANGLHQEGLAAIRMLAEALKSSALDQYLIHRVARFLEVSRKDPSIRCDVQLS